MKPDLIQLPISSPSASIVDTLNSNKPLLHESLQSLGSQRERQKQLASLTDLNEIKQNEIEITDLLETVQGKCIKILDTFVDNYTSESEIKLPTTKGDETFPSELAFLVERIANYLKQSKEPIVEQRRSFMTKKRPIDKNTILKDILSSIDRLEVFILDNPVDVFDKLYTIKGKMENQTFHLTPYKEKMMDFTKTLELIQKHQSNLGDQRAGMNGLSTIVNKIPIKENIHFEKQKYHPSKEFEEKLEIAKLSKIIDRIERSKLSNQVQIIHLGMGISRIQGNRGIGKIEH